MLTGVRPMYSPSAQMGWSGVVSIRSAPALAVIAGGARGVQVEESGRRRDHRVVRAPVDRERVEQTVVHRIAVRDLQARAHHPGVHDIDAGGMELGPLTIHLGAVRDILSRPSLGHVDGVREHAVLVLQLATRLLLGLDADVQPLDEVPIRDIDVPDLERADPRRSTGSGRSDRAPPSPRAASRAPPSPERSRCRFPRAGSRCARGRRSHPRPRGRRWRARAGSHRRRSRPRGPRRRRGPPSPVPRRRRTSW